MKRKRKKNWPPKENLKKEVAEFCNELRESPNRTIQVRNEDGKKTRVAVRFCECCFKCLYHEFVQHYKEKHNVDEAPFSYGTWLSAGYKPKWVKIAQQATDLCPICELAKNHIPKQKSDNTNKDKNEAISKLEEIHKHHVQHKDAQRKLFKSQIESIADNEMVMVLDFKEKIKLGAGPRQVNQQFYQYTQRSLLCVYIFLSNGRKIVKDFISDEIHQVIFVKKFFFFFDGRI